MGVHVQHKWQLGIVGVKWNNTNIVRYATNSSK